MAQIETDGREEQRERNRQDHDERRAHIPEEKKQDDGDQQDALGQVVHHRVRREVHQIAAIEKGNDLHARRQKMIVQIVDFFMQRRQHGVAVRAFAQQHNAFDGVGIIDESRRPGGGWLCRSAPAGSSALASRRRYRGRRSACHFAFFRTVSPMSLTLRNRPTSPDVNLLLARLG